MVSTPVCLNTASNKLTTTIGGGASEMAIITMTMEMNNIIITGLESHPAKSHDMIEMLLVQHIRALRGHPDLKDAWIIFFPENNVSILSQNPKQTYLTIHTARTRSVTHGTYGEKRTQNLHLLRKG